MLRLWQGVGSAIPARLAQMLSPLILIPWLLGYLGDSLYGFWMTVTAVVGMLSFADLGLGNAVMARLPPLLASRRDEQARQLISSSYALLTGLAGCLMLIAILLSSLLPIEEILSDVQLEDHSIARSILLVTSLAFLSNVPLGLVIRVQFARQRAGQAYLVAAASSITALGLTILAVQLDLGPIAVIATNLAVPPLVNLVYTAILFGGPLRNLAPSAAMVGSPEVRSAFAGGLPFLLLTGLLSAVTASDYLLVERLAGVSQVAEFSITARLLLQAGALITLVTMPFWPASSDALARGDFEWVVTARRRMSVMGASVMLVGLAGLLGLGPWFYEIWLGPEMPFSHSLAAGLGVWWFLQALMSPTFMVQNSLSRLRPQLIGATLYLVLSVPLKVLAVGAYGVSAIGWVSSVSYLLTMVPAAVLGYRWAMRDRRLEFDSSGLSQ
jgi:O-antigen/teichoic acid export membrane protein